MGIAVKSGDLFENPYLKRKSQGNLFDTAKKSALERQDMHTLLRGLKNQDNKKEKAYIGTSIYSQNDFMKSAGLPDKKEIDQLRASHKYNFKEVSNQIQRAKTSVSAGAAVIKARRAVSELKRKLSSAKDDKEELEIALNHAKRIERVAKKKKRNLELEELIEATGKKDEGEGESSVASREYDETDKVPKDKMDEDIPEEEYDEYSDIEEMDISDHPDMTGDAGYGAMSELTSELFEAMSELTEDLSEPIEDAMEMLSELEIMDPHMSEEELSELRIKHRNAERKDIVKADMDYLKDMIEHYEKVQQQAAVSPAASFDMSGAALSAAVSVGADVGSVSIDISV